MPDVEDGYANTQAEWRRWASGTGVPNSDAAGDLAWELRLTGATVGAAMAAARTAAGSASAQDRLSLRAEIIWIDSVVKDLIREGAPDWVLARYRARLQAVTAALETPRRLPAQQPAPPRIPPTRTVPAPPPVTEIRPVTPPRAPRPPLGPSLQAFVSEHSILILSYTGAFLLFIATLLYELYGIEQLSGGLRFAGVLVLDLIFAAAGWACLRSRRLRIVGHSYVAIAALLVPLVSVAAYVFLGLAGRGVSQDLALALSGAACAILYAALALRLRLHPYAVLALLALGAAAVGAVDLAGLGAWRGPALVPLAFIYLLLDRRPGLLPGWGDLFSRYARWFVPAAALLALGVALPYAKTPWVVTVTLLSLGLAWLLHRALGGPIESAYLGPAALLVGWTLAGYDASFGRWWAVSLTPLAAAYAFAWRRWLPEAKPFQHLAIVIAAIVMSGEMSAFREWLPWATPVFLLGVGAVYLLDRRLGGDELAADLGFGAVALAFAGFVSDLSLAPWRGAVTGLLVAGFALLASRRWRLLSSHVHDFVHGTAGLAVVLTAADLAQASGWVPWAVAAAAGVVAVGYALDARVNRRVESTTLAFLAFGAAWAAGLSDLHVGVWRGPAMALLAALYVFARRVGGPLVRRHAGYRVHVAAVAAVLFTAYHLGNAGAWLPWVATATLAGLAGAYLLDVAFGGKQVSAYAALTAAGLALISLGHDAGLGRWEPLALAALAVAYVAIRFRARRLGPIGAELARAGEVFIHLAAGAAVFVALAQASPAPLDLHAVAAVLATVAAAYALYGWLSGREPAYLGAAAAFSSAVLFENFALSWGETGAVLELVALGGGYALLSGRFRLAWLPLAWRVGMAVQLGACAALQAQPELLQAVALAAAAAIVSSLSHRSRQPEWLALAASLVVVAWYWLGTALLPPPPNPTTDDLALLMSPLPVLLGAVGLGLRTLAGRRWALPVQAVAALLALAVIIFPLAFNDYRLEGAALLAYAAVVYASAAVERLWPGAVVALGLAAAGLTSLLYAAHAAGAAYPVVLVLFAAGVYTLQPAWQQRFQKNSDWIQAHRFLALTGAALTAAASPTVAGFLTSHNPGAVSGAFTLLVLAGLLFADSRLHGQPILDYAGILAGSLTGLWVASYLGAVNVQWYVAVPGACLVAVGLRLPFDRRVTYPDPPVTAQLLVGAGVALLFGTSAVQAIFELPSAWFYTSVLAVEGLAGIFLGIGMRSRILVISGSSAITVAALRALFVVISQQLIPLFAIFGLLALLLLALGACLALLRDRIPEARTLLAKSWRDWN